MLKPADIDSLFDNFGEILTPSEVATTIRASDSYICELINNGVLPCFRIGAHYRLLKRDVVEYFIHSVEAQDYLGPPAVRAHIDPPEQAPQDSGPKRQPRRAVSPKL